MSEKTAMDFEDITQVYGTPIKVIGEPMADMEHIKQQAELARECLVSVDYFTTRGTCGDERLRIGLLSGSIRG